MAPAPPPPATGTSFHAYPSLVRSCLRTFSAAASPPEVHQCSICTSLMSAAFAVAAKPRTDAAIALVNSRLRGFIVLPSRAYSLPPDSVRLRFQKPCVGFRSFFVHVRSGGAPPAHAQTFVNVERLLCIVGKRRGEDPTCRIHRMAGQLPFRCCQRSARAWHGTPRRLLRDPVSSPSAHPRAPRSVRRGPRLRQS